MDPELGLEQQQQGSPHTENNRVHQETYSSHSLSLFQSNSGTMASWPAE